MHLTDLNAARHTLFSFNWDSVHRDNYWPRNPKYRKWSWEEKPTKLLLAKGTDDRTLYHVSQLVEDWFEKAPSSIPPYRNRWFELLGSSHQPFTRVTFFSRLQLSNGLTFYCDPHYWGNGAFYNGCRSRYDILPLKCDPPQLNYTKDNCMFAELLLCFHLAGPAGGDFCYVRYFKDLKQSEFRKTSPFRHLVIQEKNFACLPCSRIAFCDKPYVLEDHSNSSPRSFFAFWFY
jgi:hypothetical protein